MMRIRWIIAAAGALALAAVAVGFYMPWRRQDAPMPVVSASDGTSADVLSCPADAKEAKLDFTMKDVQNKDVTLSQFKGKVLVLDFWATWCGPCKVEIPHFVEFQDKYGKDGLQIVGISVDDPLDKLQPYVSDMKMNYTVLQGLGHEEVQDAYGPILGIPVTVVVSREGKICATHTGLTGKEAFEREIKALL